MKLKITGAAVLVCMKAYFHTVRGTFLCPQGPAQVAAADTWWHLFGFTSKDNISVQFRRKCDGRNLISWVSEDTNASKFHLKANFPQRICLNRNRVRTRLRGQQQRWEMVESGRLTGAAGSSDPEHPHVCFNDVIVVHSLITQQPLSLTRATSHTTNGRTVFGISDSHTRNGDLG